VNIAIMRVFLRLRETLALHQKPAHRLDELERIIEAHDSSIRTLFGAIPGEIDRAGCWLPDRAFRGIASAGCA
jgi:hypothetical protein